MAGVEDNRPAILREPDRMCVICDRKTEESCGNGLQTRRMHFLCEADEGTICEWEKGGGGLPSLVAPCFLHSGTPSANIPPNAKRDGAKGKFERPTRHWIRNRLNRRNAAE